MTPLEIRLLLHIHVTPMAFENEHAPAVREAIAQFMGDELITVEEKCPSDEHPYRLTERGRAMVNHLCDTPLPVCKWLRPSECP